MIKIILTILCLVSFFACQKANEADKTTDKTANAVSDTSNTTDATNIEVLAEKIAELKEASKTPLYEKITQQITQAKAGDVVETKGKSFIYLPEGCLLDQNGKEYKGTSEIKVREAISMNDFIKFGLTTKAEKGILESGGMLEIAANDMEGKPLRMNPEIGMRLSMPIYQASSKSSSNRGKTNDPNDGFQLFKGNKSNSGEIIWKEAPKENKITPEDLAEIKQFNEIKKFIESVEKMKNNPECNQFESTQDLKAKGIKNYMFNFENTPNNLDIVKDVISNYKSLENNDWVVDPLYQIDGKIYAAIFYGMVNANEKVPVEQGQDKLPKNNAIPVKIKGYTSNVYLFDITVSYKKLNKKFNKMKGNKALSDKINRYRTKRLEYTINSLGWYNCDRYPETEKFAGNIEIETATISKELLPYIKLSWVQPDLNIQIRSDNNGENKFNFQGIKQSRGFILAWIPGLYVGSLEFSEGQIKDIASKGGNFGKLKFQPADDSKVNEIIEKLTRKTNVAAINDTDNYD